MHLLVGGCLINIDDDDVDDVDVDVPIPTNNTHCLFGLLF
jgi:hypothetical protein